MRKKLVIGNWKMNGGRATNARLLADVVSRVSGADGIDIAVCVPFPYLGNTSQHLFGCRVGLGAQDINEHESGAFTGEVSGSMLIDFDCHFVLVGHSERRDLFGETNERVAAKFEAALKSGLEPVLCVGETLAQRNAGQTNEVVFEQLQAVVDRVGVSRLQDGVIAYEPVWAIGTGETASPAQAQAVHLALRDYIRALDSQTANDVQILYGGSVKADNALSLFSEPDIDGGLIGGASLDADSFSAVCLSAKAAS
ncbi:triose-phosphate isomerase [Pseudomonas sp. DWRC2-2]|uniref:triose-phosphate isomerase n=1 Tax=Pseudomonas sp. DWRC2-2 TaxID=2804567 RepID=UPI003CF7B812